MQLTVRPAKRASWPLGLLGMVVLVGVVEWYVACHDVDFSLAGPSNWRYGVWSASRETKGIKLLALGTSLVKHGLQSRVVERETGRSTLNLAVFSGQMSSSYYLLKRAIDSRATPNAILIDCQDGPVPRPLRDQRPEGVEANLRCWPELLGLADLLDLSVATSDASLFGELALARLLPSYRARYEIRSDVLAALRGQVGSSRSLILTFRRNWLVNRGTHIVARNSVPPPSPTEPSGPGPHADFSTSRWVRNKLSLAYSERLLDLAAAHRIKVFWLIPPVGPEAQFERDREGIDEYFTRVAHWALSRSPDLVVLDARRSGYPRSAFVDKVHLNREGGGRYSLDVGSAIRQTFASGLGTSRWIDLPGYRALDRDLPVEDFSESMFVLGKAGTVRR
ncbi:hypothetical protein ACYOEI_09420 [Singulisphaera rosea]